MGGGGQGQQHCSSRRSLLKRTEGRFDLLVLYEYRPAGLQYFTRVCSAGRLRKEKQGDSHHFLEALVNGPLLISCQAGPCLCLRLPPGHCAGEAPADFPAGFPAAPPAAVAPRIHSQPCRAKGGDAASASWVQVIPPKSCLFDCLLPCLSPSGLSPPSTVQVPQRPALSSTEHRNGGGEAKRAGAFHRQPPEAGSHSTQRPGCPGPALQPLRGHSRPNRGHLQGSLDKPGGRETTPPAEQKAGISGLTDLCHL